MRSLLPTLALTLVALPALSAAALASSIEPVATGGQGHGSVATISCAQCPPLKVAERAQTYVVPDLEPGTQKVEIRDVDGEKKVFRSESWFGGSPVVFVHKATEETVDTADKAPAQTPAETADTVDIAATTGALDAGAAHAAVTASAAAQKTPSHDLDPSTFELRLN